MRYLFWLPIRVTHYILNFILALFALLTLVIMVIMKSVRSLPILGVLILLVLLPLFALGALICVALNKIHMKTVVALDFKFGFADTGKLLGKSRVTSLVLTSIIALFEILFVLLVAIMKIVRALPVLGVLIYNVLGLIFALTAFILTAVNELYMKTLVAIDLKFGFAEYTETVKLLEKYGVAIFDDKTGQTYKEAWDSNRDSKWRYKIGIKLHRLDAIMKIFQIIQYRRLTFPRKWYSLQG